MTITVSPGSLAAARPAWPESGPIRVALVNNMPDAALRATERQFRDLIARGAAGRAVALTVYHIPQTPRGEAGTSHCQAFYRPLDALYRDGADALVVTGCEPKAGSLRDEPFWPAFTGLVDWARDNTLSALWSCLAAHAAVLHLDGVERRRLPRKLSGVYACERVADHPLVAGTGAVRVPHSRYNDLPEAALTEAGYSVLTRSRETGVDTFVKSMPSTFVFLQGHPEYEADTLAREFRRDIERCLSGTSAVIPYPPENYAGWPVADPDAADTARLTALQALAGRIDPHAMPPASWREDSGALYRNWLDGVGLAKGTALPPVAALGRAAAPVHP